MWVATTKGFYSVVAHRFKDDTFIIRCRVKGDLLALEDYLPGVGKELYTDMAADYPYRADVPAGAWALAMARISTEIDYDNFKNAVADRQGKKRASIYMGVWSQLLKLEPPGALQALPEAPLGGLRHHRQPLSGGRAPALRGSAE